jgi:hypothetical protein
MQELQWGCCSLLGFSDFDACAARDGLAVCRPMCLLVAGFVIDNGGSSVASCLQDGQL